MAAVFFLIGARGSGKSTLGRMAASALGLSFADTDELLARRWRASRQERAPGRAPEAQELSAAEAVGLIPSIIESVGWETFRRLESAALREAALGRRVIATGGGIVLDAGNRDFMRRCGTCVYLRAAPAVLAGRIKNDRNVRPSLTGRPAELEIAEVLRARESLYMELADHVLDAGAPAEAAARLLCGLIAGAGPERRGT